MKQSNFFSKLSRGKYARLLILILLFYVITPTLQEDIFSLLILNVFFIAMILFTLSTLITKKRLFKIALVLALAAISTELLAQYTHLTTLFFFGRLSACVFFTFTACILLSEVLSYEKITVDRIHGAVCVYFFVGFAWGYLYMLIETLAPGAFSIKDSSASMHNMFDLLYFSFVTLTTLGYGDIVPTMDLTKTLSTAEAAIGQIYTIVLVSRLVGYHVSQATSRNND